MQPVGGAAANHINNMQQVHDQSQLILVCVYRKVTTNQSCFLDDQVKVANSVLIGKDVGSWFPQCLHAKKLSSLEIIFDDFKKLICNVLLWQLKEQD